MAEKDEEESLDLMIAQRSQRPSYARMISWEFKEPEPSKRQRRRSKRQSGDISVGNQEAKGFEDDVDYTLDRLELEGDCEAYESEEDISVCCSSSSSLRDDQHFLSVPSHSVDDCISSGEESRYFSAEEVIIDSESGSEESLKSDRPTTSAEKEDPDKEENLVEDDNLFVSSKTADKTSSHCHHRAASKKQKRKRRKHYYLVTYGNHIKPFSNCDFDINSEISAHHDSTNIDLCKPVPSLVELCIKSVHKNTEEFVPKSMKHLFECSYVDNSFRKFQLTWLQGMLAQCEPEDNFIKHCKYQASLAYGPKCKYNKKDVCKYLIPTRNVWTSRHFPQLTSSSVDYKGNEVSASLPHSNMEEYVVNRTDNKYLSIPYLRAGFRVLAALASLLDLMMPISIAPFFGRRRHSSSTEEEQTNKAVMAVLGYLRYAVSKRYPTVVEHCFDKAIPYVFWARGDIQHAKHFFMLLSQKETQGKFRSFYLNEIGRMHAHIGEKNTAIQFYRLAADATLEGINHISSSDQVTTQMLMLIANVFDQGPMTMEKARNAAMAWNHVITSPYLYPTDNLLCHIMDSFLCIHSGNFPAGEGRGWLEDARCRLLNLSDREPDLLFYLSMVLAMLGEDQESRKTYWEYVKRSHGGSDAPGMEMVTMLRMGNKGNPWQVLLDTVTKTENTIPLLPVVWRTHLGALRTTRKSCTAEADLCNRALHLRCDEEGNITGDFQMVLPPMRAISLNPYTGVLMFPMRPSKTEVWNSRAYYKLNELVPDNFITPTLIDLKGEEENPGYRVRFCMAKKACSYLGYDSTNTDFATLIWTGENGEKARLNLIVKMKEIAYKKCETIIQKQRLYKYNLPTWREDALKVLKMAKARGYEMNFSTISSQANVYGKQVLEAKKKVNKLENRKETVSKALRMTAEGKHFDVKYMYPFKIKVLLNRVHFLGNNIIFCVVENNVNYQVVVNCSSKTDFLNPKITESYLHSTPVTWMNKKENHIPGAELYPVLNSLNLSLIDKNGEKKDVNMNQKMVDTSAPMKLSIVGRKVFSIGINQRIWCLEDSKFEEIADMEHVYDMDQIYRVFVLQGEGGISFIKADIQPQKPLKPLKIHIAPEYKGLPLTVDDSSTHICLKSSNPSIKLIGERRETRNGYDVYRAAVTTDNILLILFVPMNISDEDVCDHCVELLMAVELPGFAIEACFVSQQAGVLVTWTQHTNDSNMYREHLSQYDYSGNLLGILPFLGRGPRSFLPIFLPGDSEIQAKHPGCGRAGWYVFIRDGHDGIMGVKLYPV